MVLSPEQEAQLQGLFWSSIDETVRYIVSTAKSKDVLLELLCMRASREARLPEEMQPPKRLLLGVLLVLAATLSSGSCESDDRPLTGNLCNGEESSLCVAPGELSSVSSTSMDNLLTASGNGRWARGSSRKRKRKVAFSHEDMTRDESFRPILQTFRDSLSGTAKDTTSDTAGPEISDPSSAPYASRVSAAEEDKEVIDLVYASAHFSA